MGRPRFIRTAARALIVDDGRLLVIRMRDDRCGGEFFILPGGGQKPGETLPETVVRECGEELQCRVTVGPLAYVREYLGANHTFAASHADFHQVEAVFHCRLTSRPVAECGPGADHRQTGCCWLPLTELVRARFFPAALKERLPRMAYGECLGYLGDIN